MTAPTIRCPLCEWAYTVPPLPAGVDETTLAGVFGPGVMLLTAINQRAADTEVRLSEHFNAHPLPDWLRKVTALQAEIERQKAELASALEKFREAEPLEDDEHGLVALLVRSGGRPPSNDRLCEVCGVALTVPEARALRDWLTEVLP